MSPEEFAELKHSITDVYVLCANCLVVAYIADPMKFPEYIKAHRRKKRHKPEFTNGNNLGNGRYSNILQYEIRPATYFLQRQNKLLG